MSKSDSFRNFMLQSEQIKSLVSAAKNAPNVAISVTQSCLTPSKKSKRYMQYSSALKIDSNLTTFPCCYRLCSFDIENYEKREKILTAQIFGKIVEADLEIEFRRVNGNPFLQ